MTSEIKVDNIKDIASTNIVNKCGTTINIGAPGDTTKLAANTIRSNALQNACGGNTISKCGTTITLGQSGDSVNLASGASQSGFGRTGTVDWLTTPKVTGDSPITGATGVGYFLNTTGGTITVNLPAGSAGDIISFADYAGTWNSQNVTVTPNGTDKIGGVNTSVTLNTVGQSVTFVFVDSTQGWLNTMDSTSNVRGANFVTATVTGSCNTIVTSGDYKTAIFKNPGAFCVSKISPSPVCNTVDYLVLAGGGGGGGSHGGGGGGGGMRNFFPTSTPMAAPAGITVSVTPYTITVGGGGPSGGGNGAPKTGSDSTFSTITSNGGGGGGNYGGGAASGGSGGGGGGSPSSSGSGNSPPTTPSQGSGGGAGHPNITGGGGGGAVCSGASSPGGAGGAGGDGGYMPDTLIGPTAPSYGTPGPVSSVRYWAGGGGGGGYNGAGRPGAPGGVGGGATAPNVYGGAGDDAAANTGGGGGGGNCGNAPGGPGGAGGSGVVMIRYKFQ